MKTKFIITILTTIVAISGLTGFAGDVPADATIKQKLLGYWRNPHHEYLYKSDGIRYMVGGTPKNTWDVRGGVYFEDSTPYDIVSFSPSTFVLRTRDAAKTIFKLERCSDKDIAQLKKYYSDWMREHE